MQSNFERQVSVRAARPAIGPKAEKSAKIVGATSRRRRRRLDRHVGGPGAIYGRDDGEQHRRTPMKIEHGNMNVVYHGGRYLL